MKLFIRSLQSRPNFARTTIKVLRLRLLVTPEQAAKILWLCQGIQELTLQISANLPDGRNPLYASLDSLHLATLSLDLESVFYGPMISLPDLPLLCRVQCLHLINGWVARRGLYIGLQELRHLTHVSFPVQPPGQDGIHTEILTYILDTFHALQVLILWRMPYQESSVIYGALKGRFLADPRIVVFNAARFDECAEPDNNFWRFAESIVQWRKDSKSMSVLVLLYLY